MIHMVDCGGQYLDGTTDLSRTFHFGTPTALEKEAHSIVLLAVLDCERLRWPANTLTGRAFDVLVRRRFWEKCRDYEHFSGHGVGHFLGVVQGPAGITF